MEDEKIINLDASEEYSSNIQSISNYFSVTPLVPEDSRSTIAANQNGKNAYYKSQEALDKFADALDKDAENIRSIGLAFKECDDLISGLYESGYNGTTISEE